MGVVERLEVGEVGQGDRPLGLAAEHHVAAVVVALDPDALGHGAVHDEGLELGLAGAGLAHGVGHAARPGGAARRR